MANKIKKNWHFCQRRRNSHTLYFSQTLSTADSLQAILTIEEDQVERELRKLHQGKAAGTDGICPRVLRVCANQLSGVLQRLFNLSLSLERVPVLWKTSCLVPIPKRECSTVFNKYRPIVLTSHIMKTMEKLVLAHKRPLVDSVMDHKVLSVCHRKSILLCYSVLGHWD